MGAARLIRVDPRVVQLVPDNHQQNRPGHEGDVVVESHHEVVPFICSRVSHERKKTDETKQGDKKEVRQKRNQKIKIITYERDVYRGEDEIVNICYEKEEDLGRGRNVEVSCNERNYLPGTRHD